MTFGHGRKDTLKRAVEAGRVRLSDPDAPLLRIRAEVRALAEAMSLAAWDENPAAPLVEGKALYALISPISKGSWLNAVWAEAALRLASPALERAQALRARHLYGVLKNLDQQKGGAWVNVPEALRDGIDATALRALAQRFRAQDWDALMTTASRAWAGYPEMSAFETSLVRGACAAANAAFARPTWAGPRADRSRVRLNLDARSVRGGAAALARHLDLLSAARSLNIVGTANVLISAPEPRGDAVPLPVRLRPHLANRYGKDAFVGSLCVEVGPDDAVIKAVMEVRATPGPDRVRFVMGWDFGYRNTLASVVIDLGREMSVAQARRLVASIDPEDSGACRAHLTENVLPAGVRILRVALYAGEGFMRRMNEIATAIDTLRTEIDRVYARIGRLKAAFLSGAGRDPDGQVPEACPVGVAPETARHHARFFRLLTVVEALKGKRRGLYRKADGVKRSWFGFVLNREMAEAARLGALIAAESLTVETEERASPQYKGRAFNKMINHGAKGRFARAAEDKAKIALVPLLRVPSRHTSTTDTRHGRVDTAQRRGDVFTAAADGRASHADAHAAFTIAAWPVLVPKTEDSVRKALIPSLDALAA